MTVANTYNTSNPLGSADPRDAYDNSSNFDEFTNSTSNRFTDRLGVSRRTITGINQAVVNYVNRGEWTTATAYNVNDIWRDGPSGAFYLVLSDYTSGASAAADIAGGSVVVHQPKNWVVSVSSMTDLISSSPLFDCQSIQTHGFHDLPAHVIPYGGSFYMWDSNYDKSLHNGVTVIDPDCTADLSAWGDADQESWFTWVGSGTGCWVDTTGVITILKAGAKLETDIWQSVHACDRVCQSNGGGIFYGAAGTFYMSRAHRIDTYNYYTGLYNDNSAKPPVSFIGPGKEIMTLKSTSYNSLVTSFPEPNVINAYIDDVGQGSNISRPNPDVYRYGVDQTIHGMTLDCDYNTVPDWGATYGANYETSPLLRVKNSNYSADNYQYPIYSYAIDRLRITDCVVKNSWFNGIELFKTSTAIVTRNLIAHCGDKASYLGYYCGIEPDLESNNIFIFANEFKNLGGWIVSNGDNLSYAANPVNNVHVFDNDVYGTIDNGIYAFDWVEDWFVHNNRLHDIGTTPFHFFDSERPGAVASRHPKNIHVHDNQCTNYNTSGLDGIFAFRFNGKSVYHHDNKYYKTSDTSTARTGGALIDGSHITLQADESFVGKSHDNLYSGYLRGEDVNFGVVHLSMNNSTSENDTIVITTTSVGVGDANYPDCVLRIAADNVKILNPDVSGTTINNSIRYISGAAPKINAPGLTPSASYYISTPITALSGWNAVDYAANGTEEYDITGMFNPTLNGYQAPIPGKYRVELYTELTSVGNTSTISLCYTACEKNGTTSIRQIGGYNFENYSEYVSFDVYLSAGEYVTHKVYSDDASYNASSNNNTFRIEWVGN